MPRSLMVLSFVLVTLIVPSSMVASRPDRTTSDGLEARCRASPVENLGGLRADRDSAVFEVGIVKNGSFERKGTAALVDNSGIFLTAAHVLDFYRTGWRLEVIKTRPGLSRRYPVQLLTRSEDWREFDLVLLKA